MSGLVGFIDGKNQSEKMRIIAAMSDLIKHRGPDIAGVYTDECLAVGFRSLRGAKEGDRPVCNEDGSLIIAFDGVIYNFCELRAELERAGHRFTFSTHSEVVLHGYEEYGQDVVKKLRGMFAFIIWDKNKQELFGARDHFGIKPFYYAHMGESFIFGSEIKSFVPHPDFEKVLNRAALRPYLTFQYSALEETFFKGVFKLMPGHLFTFCRGDLSIRKYFSISFSPGSDSAEAVMRELKEGILRSVEDHKMGDLSAGALLSGGVDSSYITAVMMPDKTFSVGFDGPLYNETDRAKALSDLLKIKNIKKIISPDEFFESLNDIVYYSDEPHANPSAVPLFFLSRLAGEYVEAALSGEGADEMFAGYDCYAITPRDLTYRRIVPRPLRRLIGKAVFRLPRMRGRAFFVRNGLEVEEYFTCSSCIFDEPEKDKLLTPPYREGKRFREITAPIFEKAAGLDEVAKMQYLDLHLWMPEDILLKADRMTMAHSLELRTPLLDLEIWNIAKKMQLSHKIHNGITKYLFRRCACDILPDEWANRPKMGFPVPFHRWIKEERYFNMVKAEFEQDYVAEFFNQKVLMKLLCDHRRGKRLNGRKIYTVYIFLLWYKRYFLA
ncbi:MAG: asparagine synthase (glutamine-hydrolyzing) [Clostridiales bacterium]|nr:asparagine synthase (glutamine-hydrolyzing) [Clostridiales bacterium]